MRRELPFACIASLFAAVALGQQPGAPTPRRAIAPPANVTIHYDGPGVTAPLLIPPDVSISVPRHCVQLDGVVKVSALVDENGIPRSIQTLHSDDARLSNFAMGFVAAQRFRPGAYHGAPAAVAIEITTALHTCALPAKKNFTPEDTALTLRSHPFLTIGVLTKPSAPPESAPTPVTAQPAAKTTAPTPNFQPNPPYAKAARQRKIEGTLLVGATIDANGIPQNLRVVAGLEPSLDKDSIDAIGTWRFNPALQNASVPVPFELTIAVTFWHYEKMFGAFTTIVPKPSSALASSVAPGFANNITPPEALNADEVLVDYSPYGRLAQISGLCVVAFIVDTDGMPQNVTVVKSLESSMDENVVSAVSQLRFKPALKDGKTPVPAEVILPIRFRLRARVTRQELFENALSAAILIFFRF